MRPTKKQEHYAFSENRHASAARKHDVTNRLRSFRSLLGRLASQL